MFDPTGSSSPIRSARAVAQTVVLDYSNGQFLRREWLAKFSAPAWFRDPTSPAPASGQQTYGLVVVLGHDFARRWLGQ